MARRCSVAAAMTEATSLGGLPSRSRARAMAVFSSAPALACFTVNGKSAARTATAPHAMVAHQGKPVVVCAASSAAAVRPTGSKPLVDAASCSAGMSLWATV